MRLQKINKLVLFAYAAIAGLTLLSSFVANHYRLYQDQAIEQQRRSLMYADQLLAGSKHLTNSVRAFAATGNKEFEEAYQREVTITRSRDKAVDGLKNVGITQNELSLIEKAKSNSDSLIDLENRSFKAGNDGDLKLAVELVYGREYKDALASIYSPIDQFRTQLQDRLAQNVTDARQKASAANMLATSLLVASLLGILLTGVLIYQRRIIRPVLTLSDEVHEILAGNNDLKLDALEDESEIGDLSRAIEKYRNVARHIEQEQWVKEQVGLLASKLQQATSLVELAQSLLSGVAPLLNIGHGMFYQHDDSGNRLQLLGSYGNREQESLDQSHAVGEGLVGQCALQKTTITLTNLPEDYIKINSGLGEAAPRCVMVSPVVHMGHVLAVVELASFRHFSELEVAFMDSLMPVLAVNMVILERSIRTQQLLKETQEQAARMEAQAAQLEEQSVEMEAQQAELKQSEYQIRFMLESSPVAVRVMNTQTKSLVFANQSYVEMFNATPEQVIGANPIQFYQNEQDFHDIRSRLEQEEDILNLPVGLKTIDGNKIWVQASYIHVNYCNAPCILGWFFDVTEIRHAREQAENATRIAVEKLGIMIENCLGLAAEQNRQKLLRQILMDGKRLCNSDAGTMYIKTDHETLRFAARSKDDELPLFEIPLRDAATGAPNENFVSTYAAIHNTPVMIDDVYSETRFDLSGTRMFDKESNYRTVSMLTIPMSPRAGEVIGVLQFINALDPDTGEIIPFSQEILNFVSAMATQSAVALENYNLLEAQKALMDSMIKIVAGAIDAKSPYTGGHCSRVPELAIMLAQEACKITEGSLADFNFNSPDEWDEFRIGAWLHDCGKVTTPEYVVDKATKLETIYNRIHEIRTRFEVLLRDAEIECLQSTLDGKKPEESQAQFEARKQQLMDDFAFIAECNEGGEFMSPERVERLSQVGAQIWMRHFDDRIGLSGADMMRLEGIPAAPLPAVETLLADKPEHIIPRPLDSIPPSSRGFKMKVPENLYNFGEIYNLRLGRGTLTEEERYKINEHIIQTILMLEQMPFPKHLKRVPEYAGTHHETLIGTGYPKKLSQDELSVPSRIMAIADIFEALTASDRPYKKAKTLSECVKVLAHFKKDQHIDPELFDLLLTTGTYKRYAEKYLRPEQIDEVDINQYIS